MVILKLGTLATFTNGNSRKSATFKSNKSIEGLEDTFEKRRLFLTSPVTVSIPEADEWESSYNTVAAGSLLWAACIVCLYSTQRPVELINMQ